MPTMITRMMTLFSGSLVGEDEEGNRYYQERRIPKTGRRRRWVVYSGDEEASRVPAAWHGWLHYTVDEPPSEEDAEHPWQKDHLPNMTGTADAYRPPGHTLAGGKRDRATGDYEPWTPN
ncbi:MAG: NADH:ubiquinone oxidoreductase subunit NDUFA12 [Rhodospirillaceae bacterium]|nr:NADH:ubiquinone oxidoreductase subunit NDUFA12 [Rhodospirillaceae bacterium]